MYNHNKAQQSKNRVHISWDILYIPILPPNIFPDAEKWCKDGVIPNIMNYIEEEVMR